jgi:hypothetical protein
MGCSKVTEQVTLVSIFSVKMSLSFAATGKKKSRRLESGDQGGQCCLSPLPIDRDEMRKVRFQQAGRMGRRSVGYWHSTMQTTVTGSSDAGRACAFH